MTSGRLPGAVLAVGLVASAFLSWAAPAVAAVQTSAGQAGPTVLIGVGGLRWSDLSAEGTPTLWSLVGRGSVASISVATVKTVTCPLDAWLTISTGQRSLGSPTAGPDRTAPVCPPLPRVRAGMVAGWDDLVRLQRDEISSYGEPGVLGDQLTRGGGCALAVGRGAAVALATSTGKVADYAPRLAGADLGECDTAVVDGGALPSDPRRRPAALSDLDAQVRSVVGRLPPGAELIVAGVADAPGEPVSLEAVISADGSADRTWLTSGSTRRAGLIQLTDLTATMLARAGVNGVQTDGAPAEPGEPRGLDRLDTVENRLALDVVTQVAPRVTPWLEATSAGVQAVVYAGAYWSYRRRRDRNLEPYLARGVRRQVIATAIAAASIPVAAYLATLVPWWTSARPTVALVAVLVAIVAMLTLIASRPPGQRLRREAWGPSLVVSATTFGVLTLDGLTGTPLQLGGALAPDPVVGGRFYGFGNTTFAVYAASAFLLAGSLHQLLRGSGRPLLPFAAVAAIALLSLIVDGWPGFGADLGGVISLGPGFALMLIGLTRARVTWRRLVLIGAAGPALATGAAVVDWLRPAADRTHLGRFVQRVVDGQATDVLLRKSLSVLDTLASVPGALTALAVAAAIAVALRPASWGASALSDVYRRWPAASPLVRGTALVAALGSVTNDSGVVIGGAILLTTAPLLVVACLMLSADSS